MPDPHPDELAFLAKIADHPDYPLPRLVFADWLEERGDRRAAWVRDDDLWEWMKPDAHDPIPGILAALPARRRLDPTDWHRQPDAQARKAIWQLEPEAVDSIRDWLLAHPEHYPDKVTQDVVAVQRPAKLRSVRVLKSKLKSDSWVEVWLAVVDLGFHGLAASSAAMALMKINGHDRWPDLMNNVERDECPVENAINRTLGRIGSDSPKVVPWLADILWIYVESAGEALIDLRADPDIVIDNLNTDDDWEVIEGLGITAHLTDDPVSLFIRTAQRHEGRVARGAMYRLGEMGSAAAKAIPTLAELSQLQDRWDADDIRDVAVRALAQIRGEAPPT